MGAFFEVIVNFIQAVVSVITNLVSGLIQMIMMVPTALQFLTYSIGFVPSVVAVFITAIITVNVVYLFVGR